MYKVDHPCKTVQGLEILKIYDIIVRARLHKSTRNKHVRGKHEGMAEDKLFSIAQQYK